jgi:hypothetical protein
MKCSEKTNYSPLPISGIGEEVKFAKLAKVAILKCLKNKNEIIASKQYQGDFFEDLMKAYENACAHFGFLINFEKIRKEAKAKKDLQVIEALGIRGTHTLTVNFENGQNIILEKYNILGNRVEVINPVLYTNNVMICNPVHNVSISVMNSQFNGCEATDSSDVFMQ